MYPYAESAVMDLFNTQSWIFLIRNFNYRLMLVVPLLLQLDSAWNARKR